jgi:hypothetical protein
LTINKKICPFSSESSKTPEIMVFRSHPIGACCMRSCRLQGFIPQKLAHFEEHILTLHTVRDEFRRGRDHALCHIPPLPLQQPSSTFLEIAFLRDKALLHFIAYRNVNIFTAKWQHKQCMCQDEGVNCTACCNRCLTCSPPP